MKSGDSRTFRSPLERGCVVIIIKNELSFFSFGFGCYVAWAKNMLTKHCLMFYNIGQLFHMIGQKRKACWYRLEEKKY